MMMTSSMIQMESDDMAGSDHSHQMDEGPSVSLLAGSHQQPPSMLLAPFPFPQAMRGSISSSRKRKHEETMEDQEQGDHGHTTSEDEPDHHLQVQINDTQTNNFQHSHSSHTQPSSIPTHPVSVTAATAIPIQPFPEQPGSDQPIHRPAKMGRPPGRPEDHQARMDRRRSMERKKKALQRAKQRLTRELGLPPGTFQGEGDALFQTLMAQAHNQPLSSTTMSTTTNPNFPPTVAIPLPQPLTVNLAGNQQKQSTEALVLSGDASTAIHLTHSLLSAGIHMFPSLLPQSLMMGGPPFPPGMLPLLPFAPMPPLQPFPPIGVIASEPAQGPVVVASVVQGTTKNDTAGNATSASNAVDAAASSVEKTNVSEEAPSHANNHNTDMADAALSTSIHESPHPSGSLASKLGVASSPTGNDGNIAYDEDLSFTSSSGENDEDRERENTDHNEKHGDRSDQNDDNNHQRARTNHARDVHMEDALAPSVDTTTRRSSLPSHTPVGESNAATKRSTPPSRPRSLIPADLSATVPTAQDTKAPSQSTVLGVLQSGSRSASPATFSQVQQAPVAASPSLSVDFAGANGGSTVPAGLPSSNAAPSPSIYFSPDALVDHAAISASTSTNMPPAATGGDIHHTTTPPGSATKATPSSAPTSASSQSSSRSNTRGSKPENVKPINYVPMPSLEGRLLPADASSAVLPAPSSSSLQLPSSTSFSSTSLRLASTPAQRTSVLKHFLADLGSFRSVTEFMNEVAGLAKERITALAKEAEARKAAASASSQSADATNASSSSHSATVVKIEDAASQESTASETTSKSRKKRKVEATTSTSDATDTTHLHQQQQLERDRASTIARAQQDFSAQQQRFYLEQKQLHDLLHSQQDQQKLNQRDHERRIVAAATAAAAQTQAQVQAVTAPKLDPNSLATASTAVLLAKAQEQEQARQRESAATATTEQLQSQREERRLQQMHEARLTQQRDMQQAELRRRLESEAISTADPSHLGAGGSSASVPSHGSQVTASSLQLPESVSSHMLIESPSPLRVGLSMGPGGGSPMMLAHSHSENSLGGRTASMDGSSHQALLSHAMRPRNASDDPHLSLQLGSPHPLGLSHMTSSSHGSHHAGGGVSVGLTPLHHPQHMLLTPLHDPQLALNTPIHHGHHHVLNTPIQHRHPSFSHDGVHIQLGSPMRLLHRRDMSSSDGIGVDGGDTDMSPRHDGDLHSVQQLILQAPIMNHTTLGDATHHPSTTINEMQTT